MISLTHEDTERLAVFLSTSTSILLAKQSASPSYFYHPQFFYNLCSSACIYLKVVILHKGDVPHALRARQYSCKQLSQFTMQSKVLDRLASNSNDSLARAAVHLPFTGVQ
jgi:hypothetical protein